ncbi:histidine kinase [Intrasporangium oryzae NRRL B-24470]|uniref:Sensor-like histidine kinase SenX3 n=1 Tax=Intrasporangium oryzae NRRL B-24470 TaxID=1386089 RepID=W9G3D9_9MICO|nr:ATP-binding protein [Intrasporangium oryzae]EWS99826.1 histidine kinase [Intrasporangium oryzae NRRL B-24470]
MDPTTAATLGGIAGLALGGVAMVAVRLSDRSTQGEVIDRPAPSLPPGVGEVLAVLRSSGIVVDRSDRVVNNSPAAVSHGLVRGHDLVHPELLHLARAVRRDGVIREAELDLRKGLGEGRQVVAARVAPLGADHVLLLVEDRSKARRVEEVRRDFLANVSHELKTPVGGISLLAEAILDAQDDPVTVARFAKRISVESARLTRLVKEIVELSRLQAADVVKDPVRVDVASCAEDAVERCRLLADESRIELVIHCEPGCEVFGDRELITTAIANLVGNAVAYSDRDTRVAISVRRSDQRIIDVSVTDQGVGIAPEDQERIFERFYRVDTARSRATGGTGLGLAIVKHVADNHGGQVSVWSEPGRGSTFTIQLPAAPPAEPPVDGDATAPGATATPAAATREPSAPGRDATTSGSGDREDPEHPHPELDRTELDRTELDRTELDRTELDRSELARSELDRTTTGPAGQAASS